MAKFVNFLCGTFHSICLVFLTPAIFTVGLLHFDLENYFSKFFWQFFCFFGNILYRSVPTIILISNSVSILAYCYICREFAVFSFLILVLLDYIFSLYNSMMFNYYLLCLMLIRRRTQEY